MKRRRAATHRKRNKLPAFHFEHQTLTPFAWLVPVQTLLTLEKRLRTCFAPSGVTPIFGRHSVTLLLIVHLLFVS